MLTFNGPFPEYYEEDSVSADRFNALSHFRGGEEIPACGPPRFFKRTFRRFEYRVLNPKLGDNSLKSLQYLKYGHLERSSCIRDLVLDCTPDKKKLARDCLSAYLKSVRELKPSVYSGPVLLSSPDVFLYNVSLLTGGRYDVRKMVGDSLYLFLYFPVDFTMDYAELLLGLVEDISLKFIALPKSIL